MQTENEWLRSTGPEQDPSSSPGAAGGLSLAALQGLPHPEARPSLGGMRSRLFLAIFWTAFSLLFIVIGVDSYLRARYYYSSLLRDGQHAQGEVTGVIVDRDAEPVRYFIEYRYQTSVGGELAVYSDQAQVPSTMADALHVGQPVDVIYLPAAPAVSGLDGALAPPDLVFPLVMGGVGLLFVLIGAYIFKNAFAGLSILSRLERHGLETEAVVFDKWQEDGSSYLAYAFEISTPRGPQRITRAEANSKAYQKLALGDRTRVKFLPNDPESSLLVEYR
jgi:hypothetical protein